MKHIFILFFSFMLMACHYSMPCYAQNEKSAGIDTSQSLNPDHPDMFDHSNEYYKGTGETFEGKFVNMLVILALLVIFMVVAAWALKRMMKTRLTHLNTSSLIKIAETRTLSPRSTLYILEVGSQTLLIAETSTGISHLASLDNTNLKDSSIPSSFSIREK